MKPAETDPPAEEESQSSQIPTWWLKPVQQHPSPRQGKATPDKTDAAATPAAEKDKPRTTSKDVPAKTPEVILAEIKTPPSKLTLTQPPLLPSLQELEIPLQKVDPPRAASPPPKALTPPPPPMTQLPPALQPSQVAVPSTSAPVEEVQKFNVVHFDPELHWCRVCNVFPRTAKEFLNHLHAPDHKQNLSVRRSVLIYSLFALHVMETT